MPYVGEIRIFAGNFAPLGWRFCNGDALAISENEALFVVIGTQYGGDGESTFMLPDMRGRVPVHQGTNPNGGEPSFVAGQLGGVEAVALTPSQLPAHTHALHGTSLDGNQQSPAGRVPATSLTIKPYRNVAPDAAMKSRLGPTGGSQPHDNMQPFLGVNFIISLFGEYPSQA